MKQKTLWIMCGIPASGKSTYLKNTIQNLKYNDSVIVSRDAIRFSLLKPSDEYFSKEKEVWTEFVNMINYYLGVQDDRYTNVYVDATHLNPNSRKKLLNAIDTSGVVVNCIAMETPLETCLERNSKRTGLACVPDDVIKNMRNYYVRPTKSEGFNEIIILN